MIKLCRAKDQIILLSLSSIFLNFVCVSAICEQNEEYLSEEGICLPCTICHPPLIVETTCEIYKDTQCGSPHFMFGVGGSDDKLLHDESHIEQSKKPKRKKHHKKFYDKQSDENPNEISNQLPPFKTAGSKWVPKSSDQIVNDFPPISNEEESQGIQESDDNSVMDEKIVETSDFWTKPTTKLVVSIVVGLLNAFLIVMLIMLMILSCCRDKKRFERNPSQDLPNPTDKPIKCRFTAVLPAKQADLEYANIDSTFNANGPSRNGSSAQFSNDDNMHTLPLLRPAECHIMDNGCGPQMYTENNQSTPSIPPTTSSFSPQISSMIENGLQYLRLPSPNPFTMDRLLENRRTDGIPPTENNHYVETWCRSQSSFVRQPPSTMPRFWQPPPNETSSPMMLRTYRSTPMAEDPPNKYNSLPS